MGDLYAFDQRLRTALAAGTLRCDDVPLPPTAVVEGIGHLPAIAGFDEAGRGALAGPVVVACVHFPQFEQMNPQSRARHDTASGSDVLSHLDGLDDSKRVPAKRRERLFDRITSLSHWGVGTATPAEIDSLGIVAACTLAARRACRGITDPLNVFLLDRGLSVSGSTTAAPQGTPRPFPAEFALTKGDARSLHIAAASILAKVTRDRIMTALHARYPAYRFDQNKGYGTLAHRCALRRSGASPVHRQSFRLPEQARMC